MLIGHWLHKVNVSILLVFALATSVLAQEQNAPKTDTTGEFTKPDNCGLPTPDYGYFGIGGIYDEDSLNQGTVFSFIFGFNLISDKVAVEHYFRSIRLIRFKARRLSHRLTSTILVQSFAVAIPMWTGAIIKNTRFMERYIVPALMIPFGSHLAIRPHYNVTFFGGITPDIILFTEDDGMLFQYRVGARYSIARTGIVLEVEAVRNRFWAWESESRTFDWGFGLYLHLDPKYIQMGR